MTDTNAHYAIPAPALSAALRVLKHVTHDKSRMPVLRGVCVTRHGTLLGTDLDAWVQIHAPGDYGPAAGQSYGIGALTRAVKSARKGTVCLNGSIEAGGASMPTDGAPESEWPAVPELDTTKATQCATVDAVRLATGLRAVLCAASTDHTRYNLNGVHLELNGRGFRLVTTDGHRLHMYTHGTVGNGKGCILPLSGCNALLAMLETASTGDDVRIHTWDGPAPYAQCIVMGVGRVMMRCIDGQFPDYRQVLPQPDRDTVTLSVDPVALDAQLGAATTMLGRCDAPGTRIGWAYSAPMVGTVESQRGDGGKFRGEFPAVVVDGGHRGADVTDPDSGKVTKALTAWGVNAKYLRDALRPLCGDSAPRAMLAVTDDVSPGTVTSKAMPEFIAVVMPMRI